MVFGGQVIRNGDESLPYLPLYKVILLLQLYEGLMSALNSFEEWVLSQQSSLFFPLQFFILMVCTKKTFTAVLFCLRN